MFIDFIKEWLSRIFRPSPEQTKHLTKKMGLAQIYRDSFRLNMELALEDKSTRYILMKTLLDDPDIRNMLFQAMKEEQSKSKQS